MGLVPAAVHYACRRLMIYIDYRKSHGGHGLRVGLCITTVWMAPTAESIHLRIMAGIMSFGISMFSRENPPLVRELLVNLRGFLP